ncbi:uncharacterized protein LODBEIA_P08590 [Lodderomyces beijingensis]|uniref:Glucosidase 2 subunit beta n=1 Tax=Lodderomyces beijingensis TaxID=1775926 RepID=A0ABP0ZHK8_9ASCO
MQIQFVISTFFVSRVLSAKVLGVSPENQHLYAPQVAKDGSEYWHCLNDTSIRLNYDQINDDICDCPDGSDEPATNACPKPPFKFYCANEGHFPGYIDQFKLNDGVCDYDLCCDGSDEYKLGHCENKCQEIHRQFEEHKSKEMEMVDKALKKKQAILRLAKTKRKALTDKLNAVRGHLPEQKMHLNKLKIELETAEMAEQDTSSVFDVLGEEFSGLVERINNHKQDLLRQDKKLRALEKILESLSQNYNPNFNDQAVKNSIHKYQEYISNKDDAVVADIHDTNEMMKKLIEKAKSMPHGHESSMDSPVPAPVVPSLGYLLHNYIDLFKRNFLNIQPQEYESRFSSNQLQPEIEKLEQEIEKTEQSIKAIEDNLNSEYGPDDFLRAFDRVTLKKNLGGYEYKINLLGSIMQDDVLIGRFQEFKDGKIYFNNGDKCWNGPRRSAVVEFTCGHGPELLSVSEPEKGRYLFVVQGESWCEPITQQDLVKSFKINYDLF